jgi:hypothetical protein
MAFWRAIPYAVAEGSGIRLCVAGSAGEALVLPALAGVVSRMRHHEHVGRTRSRDFCPSLTLLGARTVDRPE